MFLNPPEIIAAFFSKAEITSAQETDKQMKNKTCRNKKDEVWFSFDIINTSCNMTHTLAVITVVYQNYSILKDFFESLAKQKNKNFRLFIADLSVKKQDIKKLYPEYFNTTTTILSSANLGYAHGVNVCLQEAEKQGLETFCVLNNDIYFEGDFIGNVQKSIKEHPSSLIGGKIYYAPGFEYHTNRYTKNEWGTVIWYAGGKTDWNNVITCHIGVDEVDKGQFEQNKKTDFITGCLMCFDSNVVKKIGYWDESYFLYYEDADYCERARRKGLKLYYDPSLVIWHKNAQSTGGSGSNIHTRYQEKNRFRFGMKYAPLKTKLHLIKNKLFD